ncbi:histidine phosphatase family protein [Jannaschia aquimarina]|uniref:CobC_2 protein n=1 Tax=Jannaschia aquimarina TaxID=935700 RepID=A0A0D1CIP6_9RHOB|nr:histidine phosphatase family protein [Jannaschia aquimarina]KIT14607.1 Alpha-ribazole phosphatase [Jannaschia aquimarina]SNS77387.1 Broad specificity phosphatase PhoE [Jannaschia aquimarina]
MKLWLVRHGPTHAKTMLGWTDRPADLSDRAALSRLSAALPRVPVISSDLLRAVATADAITGDRPRLPHDPGLREFNYGAWEDRAFDDLDAEDPDLFRGFLDRPHEVRPPGGELWDEVAARVGTALDRTGAEELIVTCHFGVILILWAEAAGLSPEEALAQPVRNLSLTHIDRGRRAHFVDRLP